MIQIDGGSYGRYPSEGSHRCDVVELQRWTPGGWVSAPAQGLDCVSATDVFAAGKPHGWAVPLDQQAGTYRMAIRVNDGYGQQVVYSDSFVIQ